MFSTILCGSSIPATPNLPATANLLCSNNTGGSGGATLLFNQTAKTGQFTSFSSLGSSQNIPVTYFAAGDFVDPSQYEISATISSGPTTGSNWSLNTVGSVALLNVWYTLGSFPIGGYSFQCSGRRSGNLQVSVTIRHKLSTSIASTRIYTLQQQSDAVVPSFSSGFGNQISLSVFGGETFNMGFYVDTLSSSGQWMLRSYRNGTYIQGLTGSVSFGGISENEYDITIVSAATSSQMPFLWGGFTYGNAGDRRSVTASATSGPYYGGNGSSGAGSALLVVRFRHVTDQNAFNDLALSFYKTS